MIIKHDKEIHRIQLIFDAIPSEEIRQDLKSHGWHWSPRNKAWQRQDTDNGFADAKRVQETYFPIANDKAVFQPLLAPNGTVSKLSEADWTYIHSSEFKERFGDWQRGWRLEKLRESDSIVSDGRVIIDGEDFTEEIVTLREGKETKVLKILAKEIGHTITGTYHNLDTDEDVQVSMGNISEIRNHHIATEGHIEGLACIPQIIEQSIFITEEKNQDKEKHPNITKFAYYVCGLHINGEDYTCKAVISTDNSGNHYYDQRLSSIEKGFLIDNLAQLLSRGKPTVESLDKYDKRLLEICQCQQLPFLDVNFEPRSEVVEKIKRGMTIEQLEKELTGTINASYYNIEETTKEEIYERGEPADSNRTDDMRAPGSVSQSLRDDDGGEDTRLLHEDVQLGGMGADRGQHVVGSGTSGKRFVKKEIKEVRELCRQLLDRKTDDEMTAEDKELLSRYEGAGGISEEGSTNAGILSEFYTPREVIAKVWELVDVYMPEARTVMEPSCGIGRFAENRINNKFTLHELDEVSARIAHILHPEATVIQGAFQKQFFDDTGRIIKKDYTPPSYDVVIGNPPYGSYDGIWKGLGEGRHHTRYEEYFIEKGLDSLNEGGILAFVVPSGLLRSAQSKSKEMIASKGHLVDAWRLPNKAFAMTDIGTDIILMRKGSGNVAEFCNNAFFLENSGHVLGTEVTRSGRFGPEPYVERSDEHFLEVIQPRIKNITIKKIDEYAPVKDLPEKILLTVEQFSRKYNKNFDERGIPVWSATSHDGYIDLKKLDKADVSYMRDSGNYVEAEPERWIHKTLYASGNIYEKLNTLEKQYLQGIIPKELYETNGKLLREAFPEKIRFSNIHFSPQAVLAEEFIVFTGDFNHPKRNLKEDFINWATGYAEAGARHYNRRYLDFAVSPVRREEIPATINWSDIVDYIENTPVRADHSWNDEQKKRHMLEAEQKRIDRRETASKLFDRYLHEELSAEIVTKLEAEWNVRFNSYVPPDYTKLPLFVSGMSAYKGGKVFTLYDQQIKGISFLSNKGNGLLAYDVGVGKTAAGIVTTVNQIQTGRASRPLIIVPKAVYTKWYKDLQELFPDIRINALGNFSKDDLKEYADNNHGLTIPENSISLCTNEALQRISFTDESIAGPLFEDFSNLLGIDSDGRGRDRAAGCEKISAEVGLASQAKEGFVFWEKTGFDHITVDEAHRYKNLFKVPRGKNKGEANEYGGLGQGTPSSRALKLFGITQLVQRENEDRNVTLLTATPFTNSPLEIYSMMSYMARKRLNDLHVYNIKDFLNEFAEMRTEWAVDSKGSITTKQVMRSFRSLPALQKLLTEYIDKVDAEEAGIVRPEKRTHIVELNQTEVQKKIIEAEIDRMMDPEAAKNGAYLVAINNMRMAMLSPALIQYSDYEFSIPSLEELVRCSPKLKFICDTVVDCHKKIPDGGQVIYMPRGVNEAALVKKYLVEHGIPDKAVALMNSSITDKEKDRISTAFNDKSNVLKVIIGSETISEGVDLNGNSFVLYNTMLGWNPTELVQVEGRIHRQGNLQGKVHIVYPLITGSVDSLMFQKHSEKDGRLKALWSYKGDTLDVSDINPDELKFDLIKDPVKKADFIISQKTSGLQREVMIIDGKLKTIDEMITSRQEYEKKLRFVYGSEYANMQQKLNRINEKFNSAGLGNHEAIDTYIRTLNTQKDGYNIEIEHIKNEKDKVIMQMQLDLAREKAVLPSSEALQKQLFTTILNDLHPMKTETIKPDKEELVVTISPEVRISNGDISSMKVIPVSYDTRGQGLLFDSPVSKPVQPDIPVSLNLSNMEAKLYSSEEVRWAIHEHNDAIPENVFSASFMQRNKFFPPMYEKDGLIHIPCKKNDLASKCEIPVDAESVEVIISAKQAASVIDFSIKQYKALGNEERPVIAGRNKPSQGQVTLIQSLASGMSEKDARAKYAALYTKLEGGLIELRNVRPVPKMKHKVNHDNSLSR